MVKNISAMQENRVRSLGWEDSLKKGMATHFSIFAWEIPWTGEHSRPQSMGLHRVGHHRARTHTQGSSLMTRLCRVGDTHGLREKSLPLAVSDTETNLQITTADAFFHHRPSEERKHRADINLM